MTVEMEAVHGFRVVRLAETTSTNAVVAEEARRGAEEGLVVVADYQSAGRGRFDRRWEAPAGTGLLFSVLFRPIGLVPGSGPGSTGPDRRQWVVAAVSLAVAEAAEVVAGVRLSLKWPNDLLGPDGRKVAGVLAEVLQTSGPAGATEAGAGAPAQPAGAPGVAVVVGVGLNVSWAPAGATSLEALAGRAVNRAEVLDAALAALRGLYGYLRGPVGRGGLARLYRARLATLGREVVVRLAGGQPELRGVAVDLGEDGRLVVSTADGLVEVAAGDVEHTSGGSAASSCA